MFSTKDSDWWFGYVQGQHSERDILMADITTLKKELEKAGKTIKELRAELREVKMRNIRLQNIKFSGTEG